ncbi:hypothetical protein Hdeb2414_s0010g00340571 [Helianthus debilis subsp. tardiflorus]
MIPSMHRAHRLSIHIPFINMEFRFSQAPCQVQRGQIKEHLLLPLFEIKTTEFLCFLSIRHCIRQWCHQTGSDSNSGSHDRRNGTSHDSRNSISHWLGCHSEKKGNAEITSETREFRGVEKLYVFFIFRKKVRLY